MGRTDDGDVLDMITAMVVAYSLFQGSRGYAKPRRNAPQRGPHLGKRCKVIATTLLVMGAMAPVEKMDDHLSIKRFLCR